MNADYISLADQEMFPEVKLSNKLNVLKTYFRTWKLKPNPIEQTFPTVFLIIDFLKHTIAFYGVTLTLKRHPQFL